MYDALPGLCLVLGGCQANMFLLELIMAGSPNTMYALTFLQYVIVALFTLPLILAPGSPSGGFRVLSLRLRRRRLLAWHKLLVGVSAWVMSVSANLVFNMYISIPVHATFRSLPLLMNMLVGFLFMKKRYTVSQVMCGSTITLGLVLLTVEKSRRTSGASPNSGGGSQPSHEYFWWVCGIAILFFTTVLSTALSLLQEHMYDTARRREKELEAGNKRSDASVEEALAMAAPAPSPMWAEALFFSHAVGIPLFFLQPHRLLVEFASVSPDDYVNFLLNAITQFMCVMGVYVVNSQTSALTLVLILTLRKLGTFTLSVIYFEHWHHFTATEWLAMFAALGASALYPFLPKA
uniref:Uncharacterized protein n=1 Tax=Trypanosoma congolense (strain IL3000) TaxID=1068625 RepID=G0UY22_TRYCI|nr:conserved hypothetical protein [Trypanosoma congolense IL3000]